MFKNRKLILFLLSCILIIGVGVAIYQVKVNSEYRNIENHLLPKTKQYNGVNLYLHKRIGQELYLSITFESTDNEELDIDYVLNLSKIALQTPAEEIFIWVYRDNTPTEAIYMDRGHVENWMNNKITKEQFVSGWDIEEVTIE